MSKDTFNRKEIKYRLDRRQYQILRRAVSQHLAPGEFPSARVTSLYLDTPDRQMIARSLERPLYKEKLRVRWYQPAHSPVEQLANAVPHAGAEALASAAAPANATPHDRPSFLELKKKHKGIVYKRRVALDPQATSAFLAGAPAAAAAAAANADPLTLQMAREIDAARDRWARWSSSGQLVPSALISCVRHAYGTDADGGLRITFDTLLTGQDLLDSSRNAQGNAPTASGQPMPLLPDGGAIMEVKCLGGYPSWLLQALASAGALPGSFSKYGELYKMTAHPNAALTGKVA